MKRLILSEKNLVAVLFVLALVLFSLAEKDIKKIEKIYFDDNAVTAQSQEQTIVNSPEATTHTIR
jgi:hypothetical protein